MSRKRNVYVMYKRYAPVISCSKSAKLHWSVGFKKHWKLLIVEVILVYRESQRKGEIMSSIHVSILN